MLRALLLDFYGTVVAEDDHIVADIAAAVHASATRAATADQIGTHWRRGFRELADGASGARFRTQRDIAVDSLARTVAAFGSAADPRRLCDAQFAYWQRPELSPGVAGFLAALEIPVCVVSDIDRADVLAAIGHHELALDAVVTSEDARAYKPRPEPFRAALDRLGAAPHEVLYIGDSLTSDIAGADALGIPAIWVNRRSRPLPDSFTGLAAVASLGDALPLVLAR